MDSRELGVQLGKNPSGSSVSISCLVDYRKCTRTGPEKPGLDWDGALQSPGIGVGSRGAGRFLENNDLSTGAFLHLRDSANGIREMDRLAALVHSFSVAGIPCIRQDGQLSAEAGAALSETREDGSRRSQRGPQTEADTNRTPALTPTSSSCVWVRMETTVRGSQFGLARQLNRGASLCSLDTPGRWRRSYSRRLQRHPDLRLRWSVRSG